MADVVVTAANVLPDSTTQTIDGILGYTANAGESVYQDTADGKFKAADANASAATATVKGVLLNGGANGQPCKVAIANSFNPGFTVVIGTVYVQSANAGKIAPVSDLVSGWFTTIIGIGLTASSLKLLCVNSGVAVP